MRGGLLSAGHKLSAHRLRLPVRILSSTCAPLWVLGSSRGGHRSHSWTARAQDFVHPQRGGQGTGRARRTPPALPACQVLPCGAGERRTPEGNQSCHPTRTPNRRGPPLPARQEKSRRASRFPSREGSTRCRPIARLPGRSGAGRDGGRERGPGPQPEPDLPGWARPSPSPSPALRPSSQPARALPAAPALLSQRRRPLPCPVPGLPGKGRAPGPAAAGTGPGPGTYPPLAPAGKPCSRENMLDCSAESAPGFPPREPSLPRPRHEEGHRLPPGPLRSGGSRPHPSSSSRAGVHRIDREGTRTAGTGPHGQRLRSGRTGGGGGGVEDEETRGDGVMTSAPPPRWRSGSPWSPPLWEPRDGAHREGAAAGTAGPGTLLSGVSGRVTQTQR